MRVAAQSATTLAVFRVTVAAVWLVSGDVQGARRFAALPAALRAAPRGLGWALDVVPVTPTLATAAYVVVLLAALCALVGLHARFALTVLALCGTYLLYIPQLAGTVMHMHHLVWFAALLAASPCADALALDGWRRREAPRAPSIAYTLPVYAAYALLACVFFFPGMWKLLASGPAWATSDNFRHLVGWKALQSGLAPAFPITDYPRLARIAAGGAIAFELAFPLLIAFRRTRLVAVGLALAFHAGTALLLHIHFVPLWLCYTVLVDWDRVARSVARRSTRTQRVFTRLGIATDAPIASAADVPASAPTPLDRSASTTQSPREARRLSPVTTTVAALLVSGAALAGALGVTDGWPFACYPTFEALTPREMPVLLITLEHSDGRREDLPLPRGSRDWALGWRLAGLYGEPVSPARFDAWWRGARRRSDTAARLGGDVRAVHFSLVRIDVVTAQIVRRRELYVRTP